MSSLKKIINEVAAEKRAIGHFNFSNLEGFWAIARAAEALDLPVILGLSEGERDFVGVRQAMALVRSWRESAQGGDRPVFLNADHTYSFERVREAIDAGFDAVIFDGSKLSFEDNIKITKQCVEYAREQAAKYRREIVVEGELGYIGASSKILDELPAGVAVSGDDLVRPDQAAEFVAATGVDLLAPAVGNMHGMLRNRPDPRLDIARVAAIRQAACPPALGLVLHGASGNLDEDVRAAVAAGMAIVHVNTEIRVAFHDAVRFSLQQNPDQIAPYKLMSPAITVMQKVVEKKLKIFNKE